MQAQHINAHVWWCQTLSYDNVWSTSSVTHVDWRVKLMGKPAGPTKIERWRTRWEGGEKMLWASQCNQLSLNLRTVELQAERSMFRSSETIIVVTCTLSMWKILSPQPVGSGACHYQASEFSAWSIHSYKQMVTSIHFHSVTSSQSWQTIFPLLFGLFCDLS